MTNTSIIDRLDSLARRLNGCDREGWADEVFEIRRILTELGPRPHVACSCHFACARVLHGVSQDCDCGAETYNIKVGF